MGRRTLLLIASILVAAVGTGLVGLYALNADDRAQGDARLVRVLVATGTIPAGTRPSAANARPELRRQGDLPEAPVRDLNAVKGVADGDIYPRQVLQEAMFSATGPAASRAVRAGYEAVAVDLGDPQRVASLLTPDSMVRIWSIRRTGDGSQASEVFTDPVTVLAVGATLSPSVGEAPDAGGGRTSSATGDLPISNVTLELPRANVKGLLQAQANGTLYFSWVQMADTSRAAS